MTPIVVVGGGGHAKVVAGVLKRLISTFALLGYTDPVDHGPLLDIPYLGDDDALSGLLACHRDLAAAIGVGFAGDGSARHRAYRAIAGRGVPLPPIVAATAFVGEAVEVGAGAQVLDRVVVNPGATLGMCVILNTGCVVEHDAIIGDFTHLAPGSIVAGGARIGSDVFVGANATVIQGVSVAPRCIIGAGAVVTRSLECAGTYVGVPARTLEQHESR